MHARDPLELCLCKNLEISMDLGTYEIELSSIEQFGRYESGSISDPIKNHRLEDFFDGIVACPSTFFELPWRAPTAQGIWPHLPD